MKSTASNSYDVVIIGAGPTGLSAGIHIGIYGLKAVIIETSSELGGLARKIDLIKNYPAFPR